MIHIVAEQVAAASELDCGERVGVFRIDPGATVVGAHHTSSELAGEVGVQLIAFGEFFLLILQLFGSDGCAASESFEIECLVVVSGCRLY